MLKRIALQMKDTIWVRPFFYCMFSLFAAIIVIYIDVRFNDYLNKHIPSYLLTSVDLAHIILGTISAALVTMTTITFSTIMVVLTTYTSQFSPRILKGFLTKASTMRVLGVFLGGFIYSILSLLFMRNSTIDNDVISATVGVLVAFICLGFFAYFIHNVATSIQVSNLINELAHDTLKTVQRESDALKDYKNRTYDKEFTSPKGYSKVLEVTGKKFGYIQLIDYPSLYNLALKKDCVIELNQYIGHYVTKESKLVTIFHNSDDIELVIDDYITIGDERTAVQDVEFGLIKMVEIALRAISPGINDPNTAIDCIRFLRTPLTEAVRNRAEYIVFYDENDKCRLIKKQESTEQLLYTTFYQISHYGRQDISILIAILDTLLHVGRNSDHKIKIEMKKFTEYIIGKFDYSLLDDLDLKKVKSMQAAIEKVLGGKAGEG
ncbi:DUF2254 domain-containing protein [Anaerobacillus alkaliphilus]|uniref:DUF2254 domain-containing protein n=1 Tax=Anaerobacillus alkaliphilus TaxID=1548597 RepID=A0A4Q0VTB0_9BACI|nr:DUF2254 domain-containing protein [Anaerobacillus alkaliphilus]RXJ00658.1 DUF2254 domain-containing protein [Anaerobacillus alkaliphilus]